MAKLRSLPANSPLPPQPRRPPLRLPPCKRVERKRDAPQTTSARAETTEADGRSGKSGRRRRKMARLDLPPPPPRCLFSLSLSRPIFVTTPRFRASASRPPSQSPNPSQPRPQRPLLALERKKEESARAKALRTYLGLCSGRVFFSSLSSERKKERSERRERRNRKEEGRTKKNRWFKLLHKEKRTPLPPSFTRHASSSPAPPPSARTTASSRRAPPPPPRRRRGPAPPTAGGGGACRLLTNLLRRFPKGWAQT